jgi:DNA repair protein RadA/Sms
LGRCPQCGTWESLEPFRDALSRSSSAAATEFFSKPQSLAEIPSEESQRWPTGFSEFDRVLGGGIVAGSLVLLGGEPGIGKSTLLLQIAQHLASTAKDRAPVLYVSGEEAAGQIKLRADRMGLPIAKNLLVLSEQALSVIAGQIAGTQAAAVIVDSIQTVFPEGAKEGVGSTQQVGQSTFALNQIAKSQKTPIFLIGHITKTGGFAGPKAIEHMVDVALYLEGGRDGDVRLLRAVKNRFGSTDEVGVFQMKPQGLEEITNPSQFFTERSREPKPGSVIVPSLEGTRPILVEIQALVASTRSGYPQRRATGLDFNRVALLIAVLEKRLDIHIGSDDVYLNVAGGMTLKETATDLGVAVSVVSSFKYRPIDVDTVVVGEVGLSGEVRRVKKIRERLLEAAKLGYTRAIVARDETLSKRDLPEIAPVKDVQEAMEALGL